jgi:hypothetical protein
LIITSKKNHSKIAQLPPIELCEDRCNLDRALLHGVQCHAALVAKSVKIRPVLKRRHPFKCTQ